MSILPVRPRIEEGEFDERATFSRKAGPGHESGFIGREKKRGIGDVSGNTKPCKLKILQGCQSGGVSKYRIPARSGRHRAHNNAICR